MVCGPLVVYVYAYTSREIEKRERERERERERSSTELAYPQCACVFFVGKMADPKYGRQGRERVNGTFSEKTPQV